PGAIVFDPIHDLPVLTPDTDLDGRSAVTARVLDDGLQDPLSEFSIHAETNRPLRLYDPDVHSAVESEAGARFGGCFRHGVRVCRPGWAAAFLPRRGNERVDRARELLGVPQNELERLTVLSRTVFAPQHELRLGDHPGERRSELVRDLRREA